MALPVHINPELTRPALGQWSGAEQQERKAGPRDRVSEVTAGIPQSLLLREGIQNLHALSALHEWVPLSNSSLLNVTLLQNASTQAS